MEGNVNGFGDWAGFYDFFDSNIWGEALLKVGTSAGSVALNTFIAGELGPGRTAGGSGQVFYAPYNALPGLAAPVQVAPGAPLAPAGTGSDPATWFAEPQTDFTPWIAAGAGALLLLAVLS